MGFFYKMVLILQVAEIKVRTAKNKDSPTDIQKSPSDSKAQTRKFPTKEDNGEVTLKTQLKKIDPTVVKKTDSGTIVDFKSRLRKVEVEKKSSGECNEDENEVASADEENKRKSTGSINSLKKLWENKDGVESVSQISPKLSNKLSKSDDKDSSPHDKKIWPLPPSLTSADEKPSVPAKPIVKSSKPVVPPPAKPSAPSNIYATPSRSDGKNVESPEKNKESVLEISQALENALGLLKSSGATTTAGWLQLSDKIRLLHGKCQGYVDSLSPPQVKFKYRELLSRLDSLARQLRSAGTRNSEENILLCNEVQNTIKDVLNSISR